MTTPIETLSTLERRLSISVPADTVGKEVEQRLRQIARTARLPGFRPGKVPMKMIEQSHGPQVHAEVVGDSVTKAFSAAVQEHELRIAGQPRFEPRTEDVPEGEIAFTATFEIFPEVSLKDPSSVEAERFACPVTDAEVDKTIEILRKQRVTWNEVQRAAQDGDRVTIDFVGRLDGEAFQGGSAEGFAMVLGEGRMLPDFESGVRGATPGEKRSFPVSFPEDYASKELAGKTAEFEVTVGKLEEPVLPTVDADFARALGVEDGDLGRLREEVRGNLEREVAQRLKARTKASVMEALPTLSDFELPKSLVEEEQKRMVESALQDLRARGIDTKDIPVPPDAFHEQSEKRVRLGLIVAELVKAHQLQAKPEQIRAQVEEMARGYENPGEVIRWYFSDRDRLAEVEAMVVEQNVVDWVLEHGRVTDKAIDFDELMAAG